MKELHFSHAYSYAAIVQELTESQKCLELGLDCEMFEWRAKSGVGFEDHVNSEFMRKIAKPNKETILHDAIQSVISMSFHTSYKNGFIDEAISLCLAYGIDQPTWMNEEDIGDHRDDLSEFLDGFLDDLTEATFYLLFGNRSFLWDFNYMLANQIEHLPKAEFPELLLRDGVIKRCPSIPGWLKNAVFYRDQGRCQRCYRDITGLMSPLRPREVHLDHIIPLNRSGTNDPTNFQLLCDTCNLKKATDASYNPQKTRPFW